MLLDWAAFNGHIGIVKQLLEKGADANVKNEFNRTPLDEAVVNEKEEVAVRYQFFIEQNIHYSQDLLIPNTAEVAAEQPASKVEEEDKGEEEIEDEEENKVSIEEEVKKQPVLTDSESIKKLEEELLKGMKDLDPTAEVKVTKTSEDSMKKEETKKKL